MLLIHRKIATLGLFELKLYVDSIKLYVDNLYFMLGLAMHAIAIDRVSNNLQFEYGANSLNGPCKNS